MRRAALALLVLFAVLATPAAAHEGNADFESLVTADTGVPGLRAQVLNGDDRLLLINEGEQTITVLGYDEEPYARLSPDGTVEVNRRSEATYLNEERLGNAPVPPEADNDAEPRWQVVNRRGRFEFHDHRIHWMAEGDPPSVRADRGERQKVFDWSVPLRSGQTTAAVRGTLWWRGAGGGPPAAAYPLLAVLVLGSLVAVVLVRRRRRRGAAEGPVESTTAGKEAW